MAHQNNVLGWWFFVVSPFVQLGCWDNPCLANVLFRSGCSGAGAWCLCCVPAICVSVDCCGYSSSAALSSSMASANARSARRRAERRPCRRAHNDVRTSVTSRTRSVLNLVVFDDYDLSTSTSQRSFHHLKTKSRKPISVFNNNPCLAGTSQRFQQFAAFAVQS